MEAVVSRCKRNDNVVLYGSASDLGIKVTIGWFNWLRNFQQLEIKFTFIKIIKRELKI